MTSLDSGFDIEKALDTQRVQHSRTMAILIKDHKKEIQKATVEAYKDIKPRLHRLRAMIPLTQGIIARNYAKDILAYLDEQIRQLEAEGIAP